MNQRTPLRIARWALILSALAYAGAWGLAIAARVLTFTDPAIPMAWEFTAAAMGFWSVFAFILSAFVYFLCHHSMKLARDNTRGKIGHWVAGALVILVTIAMAPLAWWLSKPIHIRNETVLKELNAESRLLIAKTIRDFKPRNPEEHWIDVPRSEWPRAIASMSPQTVTVFPPNTVDIMTEGFFDGGFGYWVQPGVRKPPTPTGRFEYLGQDVYSYHPY